MAVRKANDKEKSKMANFCWSKKSTKKLEAKNTTANENPNLLFEGSFSSRVV